MLGKNYFIKLVFLLLSLFLFSSSLYSEDECAGLLSSTDFSSTLSSSNLSYIESDSVSKLFISDTFYINVSEPGDVNITITSNGNQVSFSYDETDCPGTSSGQTSFSKTFSSATDFNLRVYRNNGLGLIEYTLTIEFTPLPTPVADYRFDECSWDGTTGEVKDSSGNNLNGTAEGDNTDSRVAELEIGKIQRAPYLLGEGYNADPNNQWYQARYYVETPDNDILSPLSTTKEMSISGWFKTGKDGTIISKSGSNREYRVFIENSILKVTIFNSNNNANATYIIKSSVTDDNWHMFVVTAKLVGSTLTLNTYFDGSYQTTNTDNIGTYNNTTSLLYVGAMDWGANITNFFDGQIDEVKIFNRVISSNQIEIIYNNENSGKNYDGTNRVAVDCSIIPVAYYKFDECSWDGTTGEVIDSSGNGYDAKAINDINTTSDGKIERAAYFDGDDYIEQNNIYDTLKTTASLAFWIKTTQSGKNNNPWANPGVVGIEENGGGDDIFWGWLDADGHIGIQKGNTTGAKSTTTINDGEWHHIVLTRDSSSGETNVYVDGGEPDSRTSAKDDVGNSFSSIGRIENSYANKDFIGYLDEIEIYDSVLSKEQITEIYGYEDDGKNYDGSKRNPAYCPDVPTTECFSDNFNRSLLGSSWSIIKEDNFTPTIIDNKLVITDNIANVASGVTLIGDFPSSSNFVEIEFEQNAYPKTSGGDGMAVVLSDANITPVAGAYGSSLGYANRYATTPGFAGGWIGIGLDEFGNFSSTDGGKTGGIEKTKNSVAIRGNVASTYTYIAGTDTLTPSISSASAQNYKYKILIDTRENETTISVQRDINDGNGFVNLLYGQNATQSAASPDSFRLSFTGSTGSATNTHSIDNLVVNAIDCGTLGESEDSPVQYRFDAWDTFRSINDRNISTKIVGEDFNLTIASLNEANDAFQDFNGSVCSCFDNDSLCFKNQFTDNNISTQNFIINKAMKDTRVKIYWKEDVNVLCNALLVDAEANSTLSSDNFAIRPEKFEIISSSSSIKAGTAFDFDVSANARDYNESVDLNITLHDTSKECNSINLDFNLTNVTFVDGNSSNSAKFDDVGIVDINMTDKYFASVDSDDTPQSCLGDTTHPIGAFICSNNITIKVDPYRFEISDYSFTKNPSDDDWLYMTDVNDMNITYNYNIRAQNESNNTTENFDALCYAGDVDTFMNFTATSSDGNVSYYQMINNIEQTAQDRTLSDFNLSATVDDSNFTNGISSEIVYALNVYREYNNPKNPMSIHITDINTTNSFGSENVGLLDNNGSKFYFGRLKTSDIESTEDSVKHLVEVEVYADRYADAIYTSGLTQNSLKWYKNLKHNSVNFGNIYAINAGKTTIYIAPGEFAVSNLSNPSDAQFTFDIAKHIGRYIMHVKTDYWLWYALDGFGDPYDDSNGSSCLTHPCFTYTSQDNSGNGDKISSGTFSGGDANVSKREDDTKKGVKVYR